MGAALRDVTDTVNTVSLFAPCRGWLTPLDAVPDAVFAERMLGDGFAIDLLDPMICAPCDAVVIAIAPTSHSITLALANGAHIMVHIGLETVALKGAGFRICVAVGAAVQRGTPLIEVDLGRIAAAGKNLVTPVVIINDGFALVTPIGEGLVEMGDAICTVVAGVSPDRAAADATGAVERDFVVPLTHGIHARPAARIAALLKPLVADVRLAKGLESANARSTTAVMILGIQHGDQVTISATGRDAYDAVAQVARLIESGMGESIVKDEAPVAVALMPDASAGILNGVRASPGLAIGPAHCLQLPVFDIPETGGAPKAETAALIDAIGRARDALLASPSAVAFAHVGILDDPELLGDALADIEHGASAARGWRTAVSRTRDQLRQVGNARLAERVADLTDVEYRVLSILLPASKAKTEPPPAGSIIVADDLLPSQFTVLSDRGIIGIATAKGGPTSHVAIMAAAAGIPMTVALGDGLMKVISGNTVILDGDGARVDIDPSIEAQSQFRSKLADIETRRRLHHLAAQIECRTADGRRIEVFANLGSVSDARRAVEAGAEGCGLLRTEFLFLDRETAPDETEQRDVYAKVADALAGRPLIVRTLDIGGDKPVPYLAMAREENPALGLRGIRLGLAHPDMLATQLRAIVAGVPPDQCRIMVPMIADRDALRVVRTALDAACRAVGRPGRIPLGIMVETPAAALLIDSLAADADFISIGTNDLSQYTLAADRGNSAVASIVDAFHPAVLRLIDATARGAGTAEISVGVCGGLASDPAASALLIGLGITELSCAPAAVPAIKALIATLRLEECRTLAQQALRCATAAEVHALLKTP